MKKLKLFINNQWVDPEGGKYFTSYCPATGEPLAELALASAGDVDKAVQAAKKAFPEWSKIDGDRRADLMMKALEIFREKKQEFAEWEAKDVGKPLNETVNVDLPYTYRAMEYFSNLGRQIRGNVIPLPGRAAFCYETYEPYGVVGSVIPWNFPLHIATRTICPALSAGNTVVLKASSLAPITCSMMGEIFLEAGFPAGVLNIVSGSGNITGEAILRNEDVSMVSFTGSTEVGRRCLKASSETNLKKVLLELGGKGPFIAAKDCLVDDAVNSLIIGFVFMQGEVCCASTRAYIHKDIYDEFVTKLVRRCNTVRMGDIMDMSTQMGALIDENQFKQIDGYVQRAVKDGAKLLCGGFREMRPPLDKGFFYRPTVLEITGEDKFQCNSLECVQQEIFGPVVVVQAFEDINEAFTLANDTVYGLGATIWSENYRTLIRGAETLNAGIVWMNTNVMSKIEASYGGNKQSGLGREGGVVGLMEYLKCKNNVIYMGPKDNYYSFTE
ncbi:MAG: aldehyde dehydrogenase family protein [Actinobacteria bacterium]|nr:aldehyde dehydrogenase family protein [Actinomycetota bacterium]